MKKLLALFALLAASATDVSAQVEWRWTNVNPFGTGFAANLEFRNTNQYGAPDIIAIRRFGISAKQHIVDRCTPPVMDCWIKGSASTTLGSVQHSAFYAGQTLWREGNSYSPVTNSTPYQLNVPWVLSHSGNTSLIGVLGCQVPETNTLFGDYGYRTCGADGFDGWVSVEVFLSVADARLPEGYFGVDDVVVGFDTAILPGPNAMNVVPEPGTYALLAFGLVSIGLINRKRRRSRV